MNAWDAFKVLFPILAFVLWFAWVSTRAGKNTSITVGRAPEIPDRKPLMQWYRIRLDDGSCHWIAAVSYEDACEGAREAHGEQVRHVWKMDRIADGDRSELVRMLRKGGVL